MRLTVFLACGLVCLLSNLNLSATEGGPINPESLVPSTWSDRDGLPSNTVLDLLQDHRGYMWLASPQGLARFDGMTFSVWSKNDTDEFASISARCLAQTPDGTIWVGTNADGLFAVANGSFTHVSQEAGLPDLSISALRVDASGRLWVGTGKGIGYIDGKRFHRIITGREFGVATFFQTLADGSLLTASSQPGLWLITQDGIEPAFPSIAKSQRKWLSESLFSAAFRDKFDRLWLGTKDGHIYRLSGDGLVEINPGSRNQSQSINCFYADRDDTLWIGTNKGLLLFRGGQFAAYTQSDGLPDNRVSAVYQDREGSMWIASAGGGLAKYSRGIFTNYNRRNGLPSASVNSACVDASGGIWVGTDNGLVYLPPPELVNPVRNNAVETLVQKFSNVRIRHLQIDAGNKLWISSYNFKGLAWFDGKQSGFAGVKDGLPSNRIRKTLSDSRKRLWVVTSGGLALGDGKFREIGPKDGLQPDNIQDVYEAADGAIWLASDGDGVARNLDGKYSSFSAGQGLASNQVYRIFQDSAKRLWFAGKDGVSLYANGGMHAVGLRQGLASDTIFGMAEAQPGTLWLSAAQGILVVSGDELAALALGKSNALHQEIINQAEGLSGLPNGDAWLSLDPAGRVLVPTSSGLSIYDPKLAQFRQSKLPVVIESVEIDGKTTRFPSDRLVIPAGSRRVNLYFTALSYMAPEKMHFRYRLAGFDRQWINAGTQRSVSYTNLSGGNYQFRVQVWTGQDQAEDAGAILDISQETWFLHSFWFFGLLALMLLAAGYFFREFQRRGFKVSWDSLSFLAIAPRRELLEERQRSDGLLLNIIPAWGVDELNRSGKLVPRWHGDVGVMVLELVDFDRLSAAIQPDQLITELDEIFGTFDDLVVRRGCERIRTNGGSYMACSGLNQSGVGVGELCQCAVEIQQFLAKRQGSGFTAWRARVGIACGSVVAGVVGVRKFNFDVFGEPASLAWHLAQYSVPAGITVDRSSAGLARGKFALVDRPPLQVSGKPDVACRFLRYRLLKANNGTLAPQAILEAMRLAEQAKDYATALGMLRQLDFSLIEAETAHALLKLGGKCAYLAGKPELAISAWQSAMQYGIVDRALEKNLSILRQR